MNKIEAYKASNEVPEGTQILYGSFDEATKIYECSYIPDVVYATYGSIERKLQIIKPRRPGKACPCVVFIKGSGWQKQNIYEVLPQLSHIAAKGYIVASVEIRGTDIATFPAPLEDVKCAIRFMRENAAEYMVDPENIAVWGDSSGGHLALMTGLTIGEYKNELYSEQSDSVKAVIDYYGISNLQTLGKYNDFVDHDAPDSREAKLLGCCVKDNIALAQKASPVYQNFKQYLPPFLIVHGDSDSVIHVNQSIEMYKILKNNGHRAAFYKVMGGEHGSGIWNWEVLNITEQFLSTHLRTPVTTPLDEANKQLNTNCDWQ